MACSCHLGWKAAVLAAIGVSAGALHLSQRPVQLKPQAPEPAPAPVVPAPAPPDSVTPAGVQTPTPAPAAQPAQIGLDISVEQAWEFFQQGKPFLDARSEKDYTESHVEGAFWMPPENFSGGKLPEALRYLDPADVVVIYCSGGNCDASHNLAILLQQAGFKRCHVLKDGLPGWTGAGHPTATGKPEIPG